MPPFWEVRKLISDRILLLQRMALDEREEVKEHLEDVDVDGEAEMDERRMQVRYHLPVFRAEEFLESA